jgi:hypothetical protein
VKEEVSITEQVVESSDIACFSKVGYNAALVEVEMRE